MALPTTFPVMTPVQPSPAFAMNPHVVAPTALPLITLVHPNAPGAIQHCAAAQARLIDKARQPNVEAYLCALVNPLQDIEQALLDTEAFRGLTTSLGEQIDQLGGDFGEKREGLTSAEFRALIGAKALAGAAQGHADRLIDVLVQLDNGFAPASIQFVPHYPAGFVMTVVVPIGRRDLAARFARILRHAKTQGVNFMLMFEESRPDLFVWSGDVGNGWQDDAAPGSTGGIWAEAI